MSLASRKRLGGIVALAGILGAITIGATAVLGNGGQIANAQEPLDECTERATLCLHKETIPRGSPVDFLFQVDADNEEDIPDFVDADVTEIDESILLGDGDEAAVFFKYAVRITEIPAPGWQLLRIDCDFNETVYDVTRQGSTIKIVYNPETFDDVAGTTIHCTFVNQEVRQALNLGGLFSGQPTPLPTAPAPAPAAPAATAPLISPPRTGDGGLR